MTYQTIICEECGREAPRSGRGQRFCPECRAERDRKSNRRSALAAYRRQKAEGQQVKATTFKQCQKCGSLIPAAHGRKYCEDCAKERAVEYLIEYRKEHQFKKPKAEPKRNSRPRRSGVLFDLSGKDLAEVALEARTLGMTYGEYTTACFCGTIADKLLMQGVSRDKAASMIANAKREKTLAKKRRRAG